MYLFDANIFIEAKNRYYAFDIVPAFWSWMERVVGEDVRTIIPVRDELLVKDDELGNWFKARKNADWILPVDDEKTQLAFAHIAAELSTSDYNTPGVEKFLSGADPWLIAKAQVLGGVIVTHEVPNVGAKKRVPLPNLCVSQNISCINTFDIMRKNSPSFDTAHTVSPYSG